MDNDYIENSKTLNELDNTPGLRGIEEFYQLFALDDDTFNTIAPLVLETLKEAYADPNEKLLLISALNAEGMYAEEFTEKIEQLGEQLKEEFRGKISDNKINFLLSALATLTNVVNETQGAAKKIVQVPIKQLKPDAKVPQYAHVGDGAVDLYTPIDFTLAPGEQKIIPLGFSLDLPKGYGALIQARSGLSAKTKLRIANAPGLIDSGYKGEVGVIVENVDSPVKDLEVEYEKDGTPILKSVLFGSEISFSKGDRIAQMRLVETPNILFTKTLDLQESERGKGGFGSSGLN
jgi:dUTP pyrophosphatase